MPNHDTNLPIPVPTICARRDELMKLYDDATARQSVYIRAPGGSGKSVSVALWINRKGCPFAWLHLDRYDDAPVPFYRAFCMSLLSAMPQDGDVSDIPRSLAFNVRPVELAIEFLTRANLGRERTALVLDDFHHITNEAILSSLPYVLKRLPKSVTVFFLSRSAMPDAFGTLVSNDAATLLDNDIFTCDATEIRDYFARCGRPVTDNEAMEIRRHTNGLVVLLNEIIESNLYDGDVGTLKAIIRRHYEKDWRGCHPDYRQFLLKTSVPDAFTLELYEALTGAVDAKDMLDMAILDNMNLSFANGKYRYHQVFLEFLRDKALESRMDVSAIYKAIAEYYLDKNDMILLRKYAVKSGDTGIMERSMRYFARLDDLSLDEYMKTFNAYNINIPDYLCEKSPLFYLTKMMPAYLMGNRRDFEYYMDRIYDELPQVAGESSYAWDALLTCRLIDYRIDYHEFIRHIDDMPVKKHEGHTYSCICFVGLQLPFPHRNACDYYMLADAGYRKQLISIFKDMFKNNYEYAHNYGVWLLGVEAGILMEQGRLDEALNNLLYVRSHITDKTNISICWSIYLLLAEVSLLKNDKNEHESYKAQTKAYFENRVKNYVAYETRVRLWNADAKAAREWLDNYSIGYSESGLLYKVFQNFTSARSYIVLGENGKALGLLGKTLSLGEEFNRVFDMAEANVLISLTEWGMGNKKEARERLHRVLATLYPHGFVRVVANEGKAILPVIQSVLRKMEKDPSRDMAFYKYVRGVCVAAYAQSKRFRGLTYNQRHKSVKLSPKQATILSLLAKGHKNAEIVEIMGISINTVRSYTSITYQKLDVNNAMDAIMKARRLGILK